MGINAAHLPPTDQIGHPAIRAAAEKYAAAQQQLKERQQDLKRLDTDRERELAKMRDAQSADEAIAGGKPVPKRHHVADHDRKIADADHAVRVAELAVKRGQLDLQKACGEHGAEWVQDLQEQAADLERAWDDGVAALMALHHERTALNALRKRIGLAVTPIGSIRLHPTDLYDSTTGDRLQLAFYGGPTQRARQRAVIHVDDALAALASVGAEESAPENGHRLAGVRGAPVLGHLAETLRPAFEHAQSVRRGYSQDEANDAPLPQSYAVGPSGQIASFHAPGSEGEE
jgi:hypothetical protein